MLDIKGAFERERAKFLDTRKDTLALKQDAFGHALSNVSETLDELKAEGLYSTEAQLSPIADWLEQFYEHGCVWLDTEMEQLADLWRKQHAH